MGETLHLQILTPESPFYEGEALMVEFTTAEGEIGIYPGHIPLTALIAPGALRIHTESEVRPAMLQSGFAAIWPDRICLMAEAAAWGSETYYRDSPLVRANHNHELPLESELQHRESPHV